MFKTLLCAAVLLVTVVKIEGHKITSEYGNQQWDTTYAGRTTGQAGYQSISREPDRGPGYGYGKPRHDGGRPRGGQQESGYSGNAAYGEGSATGGRGRYAEQGRYATAGSGGYSYGDSVKPPQTYTPNQAGNINIIYGKN